MLEDIEGRSAEELINLAESDISLKNYSKAILSLQKAAKLTPNDRKVWFLMGEAYRFSGQVKNAVESYLKANEILEDAETYNKMGFIIQHKLKKYTEALAFYIKAVELDPSYKIAWNNLGLTYHSLTDFDKALKCYEEALKIDPNYALVYNNLGWLYEKLKKDKKRAISYYEKAIETDTACLFARKNLSRFKSSKKGNAEDWNQEGRAYLEMRKYKAALKYFKKAIALNPKERTYYFNVGLAFLRLRKYKDAIIYYQKANEISPDFDTYNNLGICYKNLKQFGKAKECYEKALEIHPDHYMVINNIGDSLCLQKNFQEAFEYFQKTVDLNPGYALGWYNMGRVYKSLGERLKTLDCWMRALSLDPNHRLTKQSLGNLIIKHPSAKKDLKPLEEKYGFTFSAKVKVRFY